MKNQKLIVRYMLENYPFKIARKNWYKDQDFTFVGSTTNINRKDEHVIASEASDFLKKSELAFLIAVQLDMGKPVWKAWRGPYLIAKTINKGHFTPKYISKMSLKDLMHILEENKLGCRNLPHKRAADNIISLCKIIVNEHKGRAENIWVTPSSFKELYEVLLNLPGFGIGLTNMLIRDLITLGMIPQIKKTASELEALQVKPDVHVKRVLYRTGLAENNSEKAALEAAQKYYTPCPMALDFAAFVIGVDFCGKLYCENCPIAYKKDNDNLCPRIDI